MKSLFLICIIFCIASSLAEKKKCVCYWGTWALYRPPNGKFQVTDIDPSICTHIIYTFFGVNADGKIKYLDPRMDLPDNNGLDYIGKFMKLKSINPDVKLLAAVGGFDQGSTNFSQIAAEERTRNAFATNAENFLLKHGFDGLDLDWEYPSRMGGVPADKENFILLLEAVRRTLTPLQKSLTIAVAATETPASISYDIKRVADNVDFINLMSYDLHGSWNSFTGIHGALYPSLFDTTNELKELNVDAAVNYWLNNGCPKEKLILGIPTYGQTFTLANANENQVGALATGPGSIGSFVPEDGFLGFNEICFKHSEWTHNWEWDQMVPYAVKNNQWVGYDDIESVTIKLNYILHHDLGGAMFWSLENDDFADLCGHGKFPLITLAQKLFSSQNGSSTAPSTSNPGSSVTASTQGTTANPNEKFKCPSDGLHRDPKDCRKFYNCAHGFPYHMDCPANLYFNEKIDACDWPNNVKCDSQSGSPTQTTQRVTLATTTAVIRATASTPTQGTTANPNEKFKCPSDGFHRDPKDCRKFYNCVYGFPYHFDCPANLYFNEKYDVCDWPFNVKCESS